MYYIIKVHTETNTETTMPGFYNTHWECSEEAIRLNAISNGEYMYIVASL